ncbi:MAG: PAS domain-containing protein [Archangium sp.]|nr:PAS domain-containing protein [Archangium sp.]
MPDSVLHLMAEKKDLEQAQRIAQLGHWTLELEDDSLTWSEEIFRIFEIDSTKFGATYEAFLARVHPEDRAEVDRAYRAHLESGAPYDLRHRLAFPDGRVKHVHERCETERDSRGKPLRSLGTVHDVTSAALTEQELRASHQLLEGTFVGVPVPLAYLDRDFRFLRVNRAFATAHGRDAADYRGQSCFELFPDEALEAHFLEVRGSGRRKDSAQALHFTGPQRESWWDWTLTPINDEASPGVAGFIFAMHDVTERLESLNALTASRKVLESVIDTVPPRVFWKDLEGVYLGCNTLFARDAGVASPAEVVGRTDFELGWKSQAELYRGDDRRVLESGVPKLAYEEPQTTPDGGTIWLRTSKVPLRSTTGALVGILGVYEDITAEKRAQDELRTAMAGAEKGGRAKSEFLANMSHEIRTPMNAVLGFAELALAEPLAEPARGFVRNIETSATELLAIIDDILDFSKVEAGKLRLEVAPFSLKDCLKRAYTLAEALVREKDVVVRLVTDDALPARVRGDVLRLTQVLTNLVGNAIKFTSSGVVEIRARALPSPADRARFELEVSDTGIGISASQLTHLFEPFTQADSSTTRLFGGTGLGLSITRRLLALMGGELRVKSAAGQGTTCTVTLELPIAEEAVPQRPEEKDYRDSFRGKRALLAEDNRVNQLLARALLSRMGFEVDVAENGRRAVEMVRTAARPYDIVFMDMQMPELDGVGATREIRLQFDRAALPIVAMTANAFEQDREACLRAGMNEHIAKPMRGAMVGEVVTRVFGGG